MKIKVFLNDKYLCDVEAETLDEALALAHAHAVDNNIDDSSDDYVLIIDKKPNTERSTQ